jgi:hypothetical protein
VARSSLSSMGERLLGFLGRGGRKSLVHGLSISAWGKDQSNGACGTRKGGRSSPQWRNTVQVFWWNSTSRGLLSSRWVSGIVSVREVLAGVRASGRLVGRWGGPKSWQLGWDGMGVVAYRRTSWTKRPRQDKTLRVIAICRESGKGQHTNQTTVELPATGPRRAKAKDQAKAKGSKVTAAVQRSAAKRSKYWNTITCC